MGRAWFVVALAVTLAGAASAAEPALSPAQTAYVYAENRRIDARFVAEVAGITGVDAARVRAAMPDERRITVTASRLISALEKDQGRPLSDAQKAAIREAGERRKAARAVVLRAAEAR